MFEPLFTSPDSSQATIFRRPARFGRKMKIAPRLDAHAPDCRGKDGSWSRPVKQLGGRCIMEPIGSWQKPMEAADADPVPCSPFARPFLD